MTLRELLRRAAHALAQVGSEEADLEADLLLAHALNVDRVHLYQRLPEDVSPQQEQGFQALLDRRLAHEPTAYILGRREFYGLELEVTPAAIIPRPETEVLVELALAFIRERVSEPELRVVDVGVGSGAIAVALAANLPPAVQVLATDVSAEALALARRNAARHGLQERIRFLQGDLLGPLAAHPEPKSGGSRASSRRVDVIAANLPYVPTPVWEQLPPEIRDHEPRAGLDGGPDGLRPIERLLRQAPAYLKAGGALFVEIGDEQGERARRLAAECFPNAAIAVRPDLSGLDRVLVVVT